MLAPLTFDQLADDIELLLDHVGADRAVVGGVVATSRFIASGAQPFTRAEDLMLLDCPTLLVRGDDPMHPAEVSDIYAVSIPNCSVTPASTTDTAPAIGAFVDRCVQAAA